MLVNVLWYLLGLFGVDWVPCFHMWVHVAYQCECGVNEQWLQCKVHGLFLFCSIICKICQCLCYSTSICVNGEHIIAASFNALLFVFMVFTTLRHHVS